MSSALFSFPPESYSVVYDGDGPTGAKVSVNQPARGECRVASLS